MFNRMFNRVVSGLMNFSQSMELAKASREGKQINTINNGTDRSYEIVINR